MSSTEKKVIFTGQDGGASQTAKRISESILADARKQTESLKQQNALINEQVKALERKARASAEFLARPVREGQFRNESERERYGSRFEQAKKSFTESTELLSVLKDILASQKRQVYETEKAEKDRTKRFRSAEDRHQSLQSLARQELREDRPGVLSRVRKGERSNFAGMQPEQAEKLMYQRSLMGQDKQTQSVFLGTLAGNLAAGLIQQMFRALSSVASARSGEEGVVSLLGAIPVVGGTAATVAERARSEQYSVQTRQFGLRALTGRGITGSPNVGLGFSTAESFEMMRPLVEASGSGRNAGTMTNQAQFLQRGLGLSTATITQMVKDIRVSRSGADMVQIINDVLHSNPDLRRDQTKLSEVLSQSSQLTTQLASQTENLDLRKNIGIVGALRSIGGSFADPNLGVARMMSINQSLSAPTTDFQRARNFSALSSLSPGASYFQLLEMQEKGIGQQGFLPGVLNRLKRETGGGENFMLAASTNLGLPASTTRKLVAAFERNPKMFDAFTGGTGDLAKMLETRAGALVSERDVSKAKIDEAFSKSGAEGLLMTASETIKEASELLKAIPQAIGNLLSGEEKTAETNKEAAAIMKLAADTLNRKAQGNSVYTK